MKQFFLASLTKTINQYLSLDTESAARLQKMHGKLIGIELLPFHLNFQCEFRDNRMQIHSDANLTPHTIIRGTPLQMLGVMLTKENRQQFFAEDVVIEGDAELGQQVVELFDDLQIDWEEQLAQITGDIPAYKVGRFMRGVKQWFAGAQQSVSQNINEYVHEEKEWLPTREAINDFFNDIDTLKMDVDRAEARINRLKALLTENGDKQ